MAPETHTPTPWTVDGGYISGPHGEPVAVLGPATLFAGSLEEREANGALIVVAVKERAALLAERDRLRTALVELLRVAEHPATIAGMIPGYRREHYAACKAARAALAATEEKP